MRKILPINPFDEMWINCFANDCLSILCSRNSTYKNLALMNNYCYNLSSDFIWWRRFAVAKKETFYNVIDNKIKYTNCEGKINDIINFLIDKICNEEPAMIKVDAYHWGNNKYWEKSHVPHYIMVIGIDTKRQTAIVIADNSFKYTVSEVGFDLINKSFISNEDDSILDIQVQESDEDYVIKHEEIVLNAKQLVKNIKRLSYSSLYIGVSVNDLSDIISNITQISCQIEADIKLINTIELNNNYIIDHFEHSLQLWSKVKAILVRYYIRKKQPDYNKINLLIFEALYKEMLAWENLIREFDIAHSYIKSFVGKQVIHKIEYMLSEELKDENNNLWATQININSPEIVQYIIKKGFKDISVHSYVVGDDIHCEKIRINNNILEIHTNIQYYGINEIENCYVFISGMNMKIPVKFDEKEYSPFINRWSISRVNSSSMSYEELSTLEYVKHCFDYNICTVSAEQKCLVSKINFISSITYNVQLLLGYNSEVTIWFNGYKLCNATPLKKNKSIQINDLLVDLECREGINELIIIHKNNEDISWTAKLAAKTFSDELPFIL